MKYLSFLPQKNTSNTSFIFQHLEKPDSLKSSEKKERSNDEIQQTQQRIEQNMDTARKWQEKEDPQAEQEVRDIEEDLKAYEAMEELEKVLIDLNIVTKTEADHELGAQTAVLDLIDILKDNNIYLFPKGEAYSVKSWQVEKIYRNIIANKHLINKNGVLIDGFEKQWKVVQ